MSESLANRLGQLEHKLNWLMSTMQMTAVVSNGLLGPDGNPQGKAFKGTALQMYDMATKPASDTAREVAAALASLTKDLPDVPSADPTDAPLIAN